MKLKPQMTIRRLLMMTAGLACLVAFAGAAMAEDLVFTDTAFEEGKSIPEVWQPLSESRPWERRAFSVVTEEGRTFVRATKPVAGMKVVQEIDPAWKTLTLSVDVRLKDIKKGENDWDVPYVLLDFLDSDGKSLLNWQKSNWMFEDTEWKTFTRDYSVPKGAKTVLAQIGFKATNGTADFADVKVTVKDVWDEEAYAAAKKEREEAARKEAEIRVAKLRKAVERENKRKAAEAKPIGDWIRPAYEPIEMTEPLDPPPVTGNTYYVAPDGNNGSGDGSKEKPWKTVQHGMNQLHPGDCLYLREGKYTETNLTFPRSGRADAYITVAGHPYEKVVVGGGKGLCVFQFAAGSQWEPEVLHEMAYFVMRDMIIDAGNCNQAVRIRGPMMLPEYKDDIVASRWMRHNIWVANCEVFGGNGHEAVLGSSRGSHHIIISNNRIHDTEGGVNIHNYSDGSIFEWNTVYDTSENADDAGAFKAMSPGVIVRYNTVYSNSRSSTSKKPGWAPRSQGGKQWRFLQGVTGIYLDWSMIHEKNNNYPEALKPYDPTNYVYGNVSYSNNAGIYVFMSDDSEVYDNIVYSNGRESTFGYVEGDPNKKKLIFSGPAGSGIAVTKSKDVKVYNNLIYDNEKAGLKIDAAPACQAYDNVILDDDMAQIFIDRSPLNFTLGFNTIIDVPDKGPVIYSNRGKQKKYETLEAYRDEFPYHDHGSKVIKPAEGENPLELAKRIYAEDDFDAKAWKAAHKELVAEAEKAGVGRPPKIVPQAAYDPTKSLQNPMPWKLPGIVEFENYDVGGPNVSFHDKDTDNLGGHYRQDAVDIKADPKAGNGAVVGFAYDDEWLEYTVEVAREGDYALTITYATPKTERTVTLTLDGKPLGDPVVFQATKSWEDLQTKRTPPVHLKKGDAVLRVTIQTGPVDLDRIVIEP